MAVLCDHDAFGQSFAQDVRDGGCHRRGSLSAPDDENALIVAQVVAPVSDNECVILAADVPAHCDGRFDGGQCGLL